MSLGIVMLVHEGLERAEQVARHWAASACPVVIHVDSAVPRARHDAFVAALSDLPDLRFAPRHRCEWGMWGLVAVTQDAAEILLRDFARVRHVWLASGSCLPLRPVQELIDYLDARPDTDFIESARISEVPWTIGGLDAERFTLHFPLSWRRHRRLFDRYVDLQRAMGVRRRLPDGIEPHLGSQWWCLTRRTLSAILDAPDRARVDRYFSRTWIPDESYFQTRARQFSRRLESRSLTLSKFDHQGRPHVFYDDHLQLLRRSDCFVARKIWPGAERLYAAFLTDQAGAMTRRDPDPGKIDRVFVKAVERRRHGRPGLLMQSRFPSEEHGQARSCAAYSVFEGFADLFEDFGPWLARRTGMRVHGHLFAPERAEFADGATVAAGALSDSAALRDYNKRAFLTSLIWNARGERQAFQIGPRDAIADIEWDIARDPNAQVSVISGAWAVSLWRAGGDPASARRTAARLRRAEAAHLDVLRSQWSAAQLRIRTLAQVRDAPTEELHAILDRVGTVAPQGIGPTPRMVDLTGFSGFLRGLGPEALPPCLAGELRADARPQRSRGLAPGRVRPVGGA